MAESRKEKKGRDEKTANRGRLSDVAPRKLTKEEKSRDGSKGVAPNLARNKSV